MNTSRNFVLIILTSLLLLNRAAGTDGNDAPNGVTGDYNGVVTTAGSYDPLTGNASRVVEDIVVTGSVGAYPLKWERILNTRAKVRGPGFGEAGGWSHSYDWKLKINHRAEPTPTPPNWPPAPEEPDGTISYPDGRTADLTHPWDPEGCDAAEVGLLGMGHDKLMDRGTGKYDLLLVDGGVVRFEGPVSANTARPLPREIIDPYGRTTYLTWENYRLTRITEPAGRYIEIFYGQQQGFIDTVTANDGLGHVTQTVSYTYTNRPYLNYSIFYLTNVDYHDGTHASYTYQDTNIPPVYVGDPSAVYDGLISTCDDVRFAGPMKRIKYEYRALHSGGDVAWGQIFRERNVDPSVPILSELEYSVLIGESWRKEHRPNGPPREFRYLNNWYLMSYSDFEGHWSQNAIIPGAPNSHYQFTDARLHMTDSEVEGVSGFARTIRVTHPANEECHDNSFSTTTYSDPVHPHHVEWHTDENLKTTHYVRDDRHRVHHIDYPDNSFEEFTYNDFDQILTHTMTSGGVEHFQYDNNNRGLKTLSWPPATSSDDNPGGHPTQYFYYGGPSGPNGSGEAPAAQMRPDLIDRLLRVIDPRGNSTWYDYNPRGQVTRVSHDDGAGIQSSYNADGTLAWNTDELGHTTTYTYDDYKRVTVVENHLGETATNSYAPWNGLGPLSHTTSAVYQTSGMLEHVDYDYDHNFRRTKTIQAPGTADAATTTSTYDPVGNLETVTEPNGQQGVHQGEHTTFGYDCRNRQTSVTNALDEITRVEYDPVGNKTKEIRPDNTLRSWDYDSMNRLWHAYDWRANETPTLAQTTTYVRDPAGNAVSITDTKGAVYGFGYDVLNRKTSATYPQDSTSQERTEAWLYDFAGNVKLHKNPANQYQHFEYDTRNRQRRSYWNISGNDNTPAILSVGLDTRTTLDDANRITEIKTNDGETIVGLGYDDANRKIWEDQTVAGQSTRRVKTDLDPDGRRTTLQIVDRPMEGGDLVKSPEMSGSGSYSISYTYTHRNQLLRIQGESGEDWAFDYTYDASGNRTTRMATSNSGQNSATNCPNYDALNRPETWEQTGASGRFSLSHYQYDNVNREQATWRDEECYLGDCNLGERFTYEPTNQLATVKYNARNVWTASPQNAERSVNYTYTINKLNRSSMTDTPRSGPAVVTNYSPDALNQYTGVGGTNYTYDDNFNLAHAGAFLGVYDAANHLVSASNSGSTDTPSVVAGFVYDGLGRCVKRTLNNVATVFVYDGWKAIAEWYEAKPGYFQAWNVYGPGADEILLRQQGDIGYVRFHLDRHGNVAFLVDNDGVVREKCSYDAFGRATVSDPGPSGGRPRSGSYYAHGFLFQGREYIRELGVYDYRNRFYHAETGRFLQTDPTGFGAGDMNLFRYCGDDPIDRSDPLGLDSEVFLIRDYGSRDAPGKYVIRNDAGKQVYSGRANENPFFKGTHGIKAGDYTLQQKGNGWGKGFYPSDQPAITGTKPGLKPGQPNDTYTKAPALVHKATRYGSGPDSAACITVSPEAESLTKEVMAHDRLLGATTRIHIKEPPQGSTPIQRAQSLQEAPNTGGKGGNGGDGANPGNIVDSRPSAGQVDAAHQATGVPSLGQESVNVVNGPR